MRFWDTHIHLLAPEWEAPLQQRIRQLAGMGVARLVLPGVCADEWDDLVSLAREYSTVSAAPGLHPMCALDWNAGLETRLRGLCQLSDVVAIGEIGLDGSINVPEKAQSAAFIAQLQLAVECELPVLIHCRKHTGAVLQQLRQAGIGRTGGIWHGFSGSVETAERAIEQGMLLGVGPVLLRDNARRLPEVVRQVPAEALVLETDAPDMATDPSTLLKVAERLGELRGWSLEKTAQITEANARRIFKLKDTHPGE